MTRSTRDVVLTTAAEILRVGGFSALSFERVAAVGDVDVEQLSQLFPLGKLQLVQDSLSTAADSYVEMVAFYFDKFNTLGDAIREFFRSAAENLIDNDFGNLCPIAAVAQELSDSTVAIIQATSVAFNRWIDGIAHYFVARGLEPADSRGVAVALVSGFEGTLTLARGCHDVDAMLQMGALVGSRFDAVVLKPITSSVG